jgi:brefeldin A-inhibited guanine nucleotide-exchange protein
MHAFVDMLDFRELSFLEALRLFLQSFRLPGEAQKIDRFMLKFAERYIAGNARTPFANAGRSHVVSKWIELTRCDRCCLCSSVFCNPAQH